MAIGTIAKMKSTLNGCMDRLIHFSNQVELSGDKAIIHISSVAVVDPRSASTRCVRMPEVKKTVTISSGMMNVSLEQKDLIEEEGKPYIVEMTLTSVTPLCPASSLGYQCRAIGPHALLQGSLNGCMDKIVSMEFDKYFQASKTVIIAKVVAISSPTSIAALCKSMPLAEKRVFIGSQEMEDVQVYNKSMEE